MMVPVHSGGGDKSDSSNWQPAHQETHAAWEANAAFWDERMGEGNDFVEVLIWPATQRLLDLQPGERVLDAACGNGLYARRLAALGAEVVAFDFSAALIARARARTSSSSGSIAGQPQPQVYFHRPLQVLLGAAFSAGFVLDGLEERAFPPDHPHRHDPLSWGGNYSEIPPVLVARMRTLGQPAY
jgi:SAM-dependent methyltransferase